MRLHKFLDLIDKNGIENLALQISRKDKSLDIVILSAGQIDVLSPIDSIDTDRFEYIMKLNYFSNFRFLRNFTPLLKNSRDPNLIVISSDHENKSTQYWGIYQPIMSALNQLALIYANENKNIKVNIFCPKAVNTNLRKVIMPGEDKNKIKSAKQVAKIILEQIKNLNKSGKIHNI